MASIRLDRREYVTEYYSINWTEEDYKNLVEYLKTRTDQHNQTRYNVLKDLSFDDIVSIFDDEKEDICYSINFYTAIDFYTESVREYITDMMREDCWNSGSYDSECYDSDETVEVLQ